MQVASARRNQDAPARQHGRHQIRQRLAGAGSGFSKENASLFERVGHARGEFALAGPGFEGLVASGQGAVIGENVRDP
jgi:hypothetical protein